MTYTQRTREHIADLIRPALAEARVFAAELGISQQALRRHLHDEGTSWSALLQAEILWRATLRRSEGASERDIAEELGYASVANYSRAMRNMARRRQEVA